MLAYCGAKAAAAAGEEAETWAFLRILFDTESRRCAQLEIPVKQLHPI